MNKQFALAVALIAVGTWVGSDALGRGMGGRGGGGGGGHRGGGAHFGGGARPAANRTPSMSRSSASMSRPSSRPSISLPSGGERPSVGGRPSVGTRPGSGSRPQLGNLPTPSRPGSGTRPDIARPSIGTRPSVGTRPELGSRPGRRPSVGDFVDLGRPGGATRPTTRPSFRPGGSLGGGAAGEFLKDNPTPFPGMTRPRPGSGGPGFAGGPSTRPSLPERPSTRPSLPGGDRPGRPGEGNRPGRPGEGDRPGRPGEGDRPGRPDRPGEGDRPGRPGEGNRPGRPGEGDRPGRPGDRPGRPGYRPGRPDGGDWAHHRPDRIPDYDRWNRWRRDRWTHIHNHWHGGWHGNNYWYNRNWWNRYPNFHYHYYNNFNCWGWATWGAVTTWLPWAWSTPIYYNYGNNVYYSGGDVYYGDTVVATAADYAAQAEAIATSIPAQEPAPEDWMSLGVFALTQDGSDAGPEPTMFLQLAVSKQGVISGSFQNVTTDSVQPIEGMVDKQTQRAAWTVQGQTRPLMETGIVNLTQDTAPTLIHFADGNTQQWLLVRMDKPQDDPAGTTPPPPATPPQ